MTSSGEETEAENSLDDALGLAESTAWQHRKLAARMLASYPENEVAFATLVKLLDDPDTTVIETSLASLVATGGRQGFAEVLNRLAISDDNVGYHIRDRLAELSLEGVPIADLCRDILSSETKDLLRDAALEILQVLTGGC